MSDEVLVTGTETNEPGNETKPESVDAPADKGDAKPEGSAAEKKDDEVKPEGAPETYDFKAPEGLEINAEKAAEFSALAKEAGLTQATAQKLFDLYAKEHLGMREEAKAKIAGWTAETKALKDLGGAKLPETIALANKGVQSLGIPELPAFLKGSGLGNHPLIVRMFHTIGKKVAEDTFVQGGDPAVAQRTVGQTLFPDMK